MLLKKIVVAEDDDAIAHLVNMALGDAGYLCLRAHDGEEALRLVRAHDPDLLVLDIMMPRVDGFEVARRLKSDVMWSRTPILMLTALGSVDNQVEGLEAGADAYMAKPFNLREFGARVKALIRNHRRERDRSPTTDLPGSRAIDDHIEEALRAGRPLAAVHFDLLRFDSFADAVGFSRSEDVVRALAKLILEEARAATGGGAFVGHLGGADFIAAMTPEAAAVLGDRATAAFDARHDEIAPGDDPRRLAMTVAIAPTAGLKPADADELGRRLGVAMKQAKQAAA
ncbi:MAG: response regulator, partial [Myxococcales bacterium]|nr:response regulator [Myxococcales bacterium]